MRAILLLVALPQVSNSAREKEGVALLQQSASRSGRVDPYNSPLGDGQAGNPPLLGHMLTQHELAGIESIACLQAKQLDPAANCSNLSVDKPHVPLNAGNYPTWKDPSCFGEGEFFCDPDHLLSYEERLNLTDQMKKLRVGPGAQQITCGPQMQHDPIDKWHYEPFYLGVAIAKDWPLHESDSQSLQSFGRILAGRWSMTSLWDGNPAFYARCPNEAMLIILPERRQAYLSSPSCMFICGEKGGPEVTTVTLLGMDSRGGLAAGVSAGMTEVYKALAESTPMHKKGWEPIENTSGTWEAWNKEGRQAVREVAYTGPSTEQNIWDWSQRFLFGVAVVILAGSIVVSLLVCYLAPGLAKDLNRNKSVV